MKNHKTQLEIDVETELERIVSENLTPAESIFVNDNFENSLSSIRYLLHKMQVRLWELWNDRATIKELTVLKTVCIDCSRQFRFVLRVDQVPTSRMEVRYPVECEYCRRDYIAQIDQDKKVSLNPLQW